MATFTDVDVLSASIRDVTVDEVAFYQEYGWVKLDRFMTPELIAELLRVGEELVETAQRLPETSRTRYWNADVSLVETEHWTADLGSTWFGVAAIRVEPFRSVKLSKPIGRVAHRLMNYQRLTDDEVGARLLEDNLLCKRPHGPRGGAGPTPLHQDSSGIWLAHGQLAFWIALDEVTPEQGSIRFLSGSHREGRLGWDDTSENPLERYPRLLDRYQWSPPLHYEPGDATVHHEFTLHHAPENSTSRPRWGLQMAYIPGTAVIARAPGPEGTYTHPAYVAPAEIDEKYPLVYP